MLYACSVELVAGLLQQCICRKFTQQLCSDKHHVAPWQCLQQNITLVKRTVLHMNAQTVFVFVKYPPTAVPVLLDDAVELVTSQQLPGVVFVTNDCLHGELVLLIMITLNDCCMLWALGVGARTGSGGGWERPVLHSIS